MDSVIKRLREVVGRCELLCIHPHVQRSLLKNKALKWILDEEEKPKSLGNVVKLLELDEDENRQHLEKQDFSTQNVNDLCFAIVDPNWSPLDEVVEQEFVYKHDESIWDEEEEDDEYYDEDDNEEDDQNQEKINDMPINLQDGFDSTTTLENSDHLLINEAHVHIHLQQVWFKKRCDLLRDILSLVSKNDLNSLVEIEELIDHLESFTTFPYAQLFAIDLDEKTGAVRGLVIQKLDKTLSDCLSDIVASEEKQYSPSYQSDCLSDSADSNSEKKKQDSPSSPSIFERKLKLLDLGVQVASAVKSMHGCHVFHLDLKPENIAVDSPHLFTPLNSSRYNTNIAHKNRDEWGIKFIDFGSAIIFNDSTILGVKSESPVFGVRDMNYVRKDGNIYCTRGFRPLEYQVLSSSQPFDPRAFDLYATGVIMGSLVNFCRTWFGRSSRNTSTYWIFAQQFFGFGDIIFNERVGPFNPSKAFQTRLNLFAPPLNTNESYIYAKSDLGGKDDQDERRRREEISRKKFKYWFNEEFTCETCLQWLNNHWCLVKKPSSRMAIKEGSRHVINTIGEMDSSDEEGAISDRDDIDESSFRAMSSLFDKAEMLEDDFAKIDCVCCIVKRQGYDIKRKINRIYQAVTNMDDNRDGDSSDLDNNDEDGDISSKKEEDVETEKVTDKEVKDDDDENNKDEEKEEKEEEKSLHPSVFNPLKLFELNLVFNLLMEKISKKALPWLLDRRASVDSILVEISPSSSLTLVLVKRILSIQVSKLLCKILVQYHDIDVEKVWCWALYRLLFKREKETLLCSKFDPKKIEDRNGKNIRTRVLEKTLGFCWQWPSSEETLTTLCTRGWKSSLYKWYLRLVDDLDFESELALEKERLIDYVSIVRSLLIIVPTSRRILSSDELKSTYAKKMLSSPLSFYNKRRYLDQNFLVSYASPLDQDSILNKSHSERLLSRSSILVSLIQDVFAKQKDFGYKGLDDWILNKKNIANENSDNVFRLLFLTKDVIKRYGITTIWISAFNIWKQAGFDMIVENETVQTMVDIFTLVCCVRMATLQQGRNLSGRRHASKITWFRLAKLLFIIYAKKNGLDSMIEDLDDQLIGLPLVASSLENMEVKFESKDFQKPLFWFDNVEDLKQEYADSEGEEQEDGEDDYDYDRDIENEEEEDDWNDDDNDSSTHLLEDDDEEEDDEALVVKASECEELSNRSKIATIRSANSLFLEVEKYVDILTLHSGIVQSPTTLYLQGCPRLMQKQSRYGSVWHFAILVSTLKLQNLSPDMTVVMTATLLKYSTPWKKFLKGEESEKEKEENTKVSEGDKIDCEKNPSASSSSTSDIVTMDKFSQKIFLQKFDSQRLKTLVDNTVFNSLDYSDLYQVSRIKNEEKRNVMKSLVEKRLDQLKYDAQVISDDMTEDIVQFEQDFCNLVSCLVSFDSHFATRVIKPELQNIF